VPTFSGGRTAIAFELCALLPNSVRERVTFLSLHIFTLSLPWRIDVLRSIEATSGLIGLWSNGDILLRRLGHCTIRRKLHPKRSHCRSLHSRLFTVTFEANRLEGSNVS
jgi:hypothetical protein